MRKDPLGEEAVGLETSKEGPLFGGRSCVDCLNLGTRAKFSNIVVIQTDAIKNLSRSNSRSK